MSWKVGQGWGVGTRAVIEASRHDGGDRKRGVKAVGNVKLDNKVSWQHAPEKRGEMYNISMKISQICSQYKPKYHMRLNLYEQRRSKNAQKLSEN